MKSKFLIIFSVLIIFLGTVLYYKIYIPKVESNSKIKNIETTLDIISITKTTNYTTIDAKYPQFKNATIFFNKKISNIANSAIEEHTQISKENWNNRLKTSTKGEITDIPDEANKFPIDIEAKVVRNDNEIISIVMNISEYTGGAHGQERILTFNYDVKKQQEITIDDFIKKDPDFLEKLSKMTRVTLLDKFMKSADLSADQIDKEMLYSGTTPEKENFSLFTLSTNDKITFYFPEYQVAPYVFGSSEINVNLPLESFPTPPLGFFTDILCKQLI